MLLAVATAAGAVHDEQPVGQGHLGSREADALRLVHDVEHPFDRLLKAGIEPRDRACPPQERGMGILNEAQVADGRGVGGGMRGWVHGERVGGG